MIWRPALLPAAVGLVGICATLYVWRADGDATRVRLRLEFTHIVKDIAADIEREVGHLADITTAGVAFMNASERVTRREWAAYVATLDLPSLHRGIAALGVNERVEKAGVPAFLERMRADGAPSFHVHFHEGLPDSPHPDLYVVKFIEPFEPNRDAHGYDIGSEPARRLALEYARDTGRFALTDNITLVQDQRRLPGFLFMKAVYRTGAPPATVEARRAAVTGLVCSPFFGHWLLEDVDPRLLMKASVRVYNVREDGASELILGARPEPVPVGTDGLELEQELSVANKRWRLSARSTAAFHREHADDRPVLILLCGGSLSLLLALVTHRISAAARRSERLRGLSEDKYRALFESSNDAILITDESRIIDCNAAALRMFGCARKPDLCAKHPAEISPPLQPCGTSSLRLAEDRMRIAREEGTCRFEWEHRRLDSGGAFPAEVLLSALRIDGRMLLQATVRDITQRVRMQEGIAVHRRELQRLTSALFSAGHRERRLVAAGLHDDVCQSLVLARLKLEELRGTPGEAEARTRRDEVDRLLQGVLESCHSLVFDLSSPVLEKLGLEAALEELCERMRGEAGMECHLGCTGDLSGAGIEVNRFVFLSVRELLANVRKHACATRGRVWVQAGRNRVCVAVEDDGKGCDPGAMTGFTPAGGFGLFSMRERILSLGGRMRMRRLRPHGTLFLLLIPVAGKEHAP